jgi:nucleotide-binding universal stress UspA family protein
MNHILTVVTSTRGIDAMLAHTRSMADIMSAKITLLRLLNPVADRTRNTRIVDPLDWHIRKLEIEAALNQMADSLRESGANVTTAVLEGADAEVLCQYAETNGVDLMLLAKEPENIGDLIHPVMKRTTLPVAILPADETWFGVDIPDRYQKVLVPLDGSQRAEVILPVVTALAQDHNPKFLLAHVVSRPEMPRHAPPSLEETELVERLVEINRAEAGRYLDSFATRVPGNVETRLLVSDNVAAALHQLIEQESIDLIILSAHGYSGRPQWPYGSVAGNLITYSSKPVLIVQDLPAVSSSASGSIPVSRMFRRAR